MLCLNSQSLFKMPLTTAWEWLSLTFLSLVVEKRKEILEMSGRTRVLIGGCSECRCLDRVVLSSRHPTTAIRLTSGLTSLIWCLSSQSLFKMPLMTAWEWFSLTLLTLVVAKRREILEYSGRAKVLIGGCFECRCLDRVAWSFRHPTTAMKLTSGILDRKIPKTDQN